MYLDASPTTRRSATMTSDDEQSNAEKHQEPDDDDDGVADAGASVYDMAAQPSASAITSPPN